MEHQNLLGNTTREELDDINSGLRVLTSIESVPRAVDKEFSLSAKYPKGNVELFHEWIETYHPGSLILHIKRESGYLKDLYFKGEVAV